MLKQSHLTILMAAGALGLAGTPALAQPSVEFAYNNLSAGYTVTDPNTGTLGIVANADVNFRSSGAVSRFGTASSGGGDAIFQPGFIQQSTNADVFISISRTGTSGAGTYHFTADNNDDLSGNLTGTFALTGNGIVFSGTMTGAFSDPGNPFTGSPATTSFTQPAGAMNGTFSIVVDAASFSQSFFFVPSQAEGIYPIPAPGPLALLGLAGLIAGRRRRS